VTAGPDNALAIDVSGLTKSFNGRQAVKGLTLKVRRGEICGFLGPNGSGKTTSIRMLCGLLTPDGGEGRTLGYDIRRESLQIKRKVGYMTQRFSFYEDLTIRENLDFTARVYQMKHRERVVDDALKELGLVERQDQLAGQLSGGWKQRMALAACMLHNPELLLLDEPTAGVDPKARRDFWDEIHRLAAMGITVLVSTHYMDEAERCHRLAYILNGELLADAPTGQIVETSGLATWTIECPDINSLAGLLRGEPGLEHVVPFGNVLHVSGMDAARMEQSLKPYLERADVQWARVQPRLEDVFIHLMERRHAT
jgi:ABC-2 type transport system ATP-binding protein